MYLRSAYLCNDVGTKSRRALFCMYARVFTVKDRSQLPDVIMIMYLLLSSAWPCLQEPSLFPFSYFPRNPLKIHLNPHLHVPVFIRTYTVDKTCQQQSIKRVNIIRSK